MTAICLLSLSACKQDSQDTTENNLQNSNGKSITFHVNDSLPEYKAAITYSQENPRLAETLVITEKENKLIFSHRTASMITSYGMSYYDNTKDDFVLENSLYWEIIDADPLFHFVEKQLQNGELKTIAECSIATEDTSVMDKTNQNVSQYFTEGSFWDLDSEKWDFCLSNVLNIK